MNTSLRASSSGLSVNRVCLRVCAMEEKLFEKSYFWTKNLTATSCKKRVNRRACFLTQFSQGGPGVGCWMYFQIRRPVLFALSSGCGGHTPIHSRTAQIFCVKFPCGTILGLPDRAPVCALCVADEVSCESLWLGLLMDSAASWLCFSGKDCLARQAWIVASGLPWVATSGFWVASKRSELRTWVCNQKRRRIWSRNWWWVHHMMMGRGGCTSVVKSFWKCWREMNICYAVFGHPPIWRGVKTFHHQESWSSRELKGTLTS